MAENIPGINARRPREDYDEVEELVTAMKRSKLDTPPPETVQCEKDATVEASITRRKLDAFGKFIKRELHGQTSSSRTLRRQHNISKVSYCKLCGDKRLLGQMFQVKKSVTSTIVELDENDKLSCDESVEGIGDTGNSERTLLASSRLDEILRSKLEQSDTIDSGAVINLLSDDENVCETDIADIVPDNLITKDSERMELESLHPDAIPRHKSAQSGTTEIVDLSCDEYVDITDNVIADTVPDNQKDSEHILLTSWRPGNLTTVWVSVISSAAVGRMMRMLMTMNRTMLWFASVLTSTVQ
uniref:Uncharacterized protein n=1 Tax=Anopheles dirus TaxID=7168 RepID=A0A182NNU0_9DIPT